MIGPQWLNTLLKTWFIQELLVNVKLLGPTALGFVLSDLVVFTSLIFCGHYPKDTALVLEGAALGNSIMNITGFLVMFGMGSALDTLAAQAYGARSYKKIGVYLQRGILIHALGLLVVLGLWANLDSILNFLQQPPCVVRYAVLYVHGFSFALPSLIFYYLLQKYLQTQGIVYPFVITEVIIIVVSIVAHYLLMFVADLGILGAGIALGIAQYSGLATLLAIIRIRKLHKVTWGGWSWECLNDWGQYLKFSIPGLFLTIAESGSYEVGMLVVGLTGSLQQNIYGVLFNYAFLLYMVSYGLRITASIRIGNELGAGNPRGAKRALFVGLCVALTWLTTIEVLTLSLKDYIPRIITSDPTVTNAINVHIYVMAASIFCDTLHCYLAGVIVGSGWQHVGAVFNVLWYWIVGAPLGISLTLAVQLGALGYWIGQASAAFLLLCSYIVVVAAINWKKRSEVAQKMAVLHPKENKQESKSSSSSSKDAEPWKQASASDRAAIPEPGNKGDNASDPDHSSAMKNPTVGEKNEPHPARLPSSECSNLESGSNGKDKKKSTVGWKTVILRILTVAPFIILCIGAVAISQVLVYHPTPCNSTVAGNTSELECLPFDGPQSDGFQTMPTSILHCTSPNQTVTSLNHLPSPTPTPKARVSKQLSSRG